MPYAAIQGKSGSYIKPGDVNYPIQGLTWAVVYKEQSYASRGIDRAKQLVKLLKYVIHNGQKNVQSLGYNVLSPQNVKEAQKSINLITYNGKSLQI